MAEELPATPTGFSYCKLCRKRMPMDDMAIMKCEAKGNSLVCEICFAKYNK